jgi:hypothetical protein
LQTSRIFLWLQIDSCRKHWNLINKLRNYCSNQR